MNSGDTESKLDELEESNLQKTISQVESALADSTPGTRAILENCLRNIKVRLESIDKKMKESERERQAHSSDEVVMVAYRAEQEAALSTKEREEYKGFLREDFFTKADFGKLDHFYAHSWDRLSEHGKDEMSHRVWEGIRHGEYTFTELPTAAKEAESGRVYRALTRQDPAPSQASAIPASDRRDFVTAYGSGRHGEAAEILNRESFTRNVATSSNGVLDPSQAAPKKESAIADRVMDGREPSPSKLELKTAAGMAEIDAASLGLKGLTVRDGEPSGAVLPPQSGAASVKSR